MKRRACRFANGSERSERNTTIFRQGSAPMGLPPRLRPMALFHASYLSMRWMGSPRLARRSSDDPGQLCLRRPQARDFDPMPLCPSHHLFGGYGVAIHASQTRWRALYGSQIRKQLDTMVSLKSKLTKQVKKPKATWVEPKFFASVEYRDITSEGIIYLTSTGVS
jgi:hypothetical protein